MNNPNIKINANSTLADIVLSIFNESGLKEIIGDIVKEAVSNNLQPSTKTPENSDDSSFYTRAELCQLAHITESTLWRLEKSGVIRKIKLGRKNLYSRLDVEELLGSGGFSKPSKKQRKEAVE